ncbi:MAG: hypothetical protein AAF740_02595 [Bacteroidota bacterium]
MHKNTSEKREQEALNELGLTLSEVLNDTERFTHPSEQKAVSLAKRANELLEREEMNSEEWYQLDNENREFHLGLMADNIFPDSLKNLVQDFVPLLIKKIPVIGSVEEASDKIRALFSGEEVFVEQRSFKSEEEYYNHLFIIRFSCIHHLALMKNIREKKY